jgi:urease accessory protein
MLMPIRGAQGRLQLSLQAAGAGQAPQLTVQRQEPPLQVVRAFSAADGAAVVHLHNLSGGVLGGDCLRIEAEIGPGARAQLTSIGANRVYRQRTGLPEAMQSTHLRVQEGGLLEYLPDLLIPYARSRYRQVTTIDLARDAGLFYWEMMAPGRVAHGELFAFGELTLDLDIHAEGRPIALERLHLAPGERPPAALVRMGGYRYSATFYACRVGAPAGTWLALEDRLEQIARLLSVPGEVLWGVSALVAHGVVVRALGMNSRQLSTGLVQFWQLAKCELYGAQALLPRKSY